MAAGTPVADSMGENTSKEGNNIAILGDHTDDNPDALAAILDGSSATRLNAATGKAMHFENLPYTKDHKADRIDVYNNSGGAISEGDTLYVSGYNATEELYEVSKAVVTESNTTTLYATWIADEGIANGASGKAVKVRPLTGQDTSGLTVGRPIFLSTTAGGWTGTLPVAANRIQIIGYVAVVDASVGRVIFELPGQILNWESADEI